MCWHSKHKEEGLVEAHLKEDMEKRVNLAVVLLEVQRKLKWVDTHQVEKVEL
tara:strand:- start:176 stop:331 length:156 start_codon:yes stop_codon:yes gene_type:complete